MPPFGARPWVGRRSAEPEEQIALVARARRAGLLYAHRRCLRPADLEECFSIAVEELLCAARAGRRFASRIHVANALEQRFCSRVIDRRRALRGRSPLEAALEGALPLAGPGSRRAEVEDRRAEPFPLVADRLRLLCVNRAAPHLTDDQRLVLASQVALGMDRAEFCERYGWSFEKYRKVAQRARARLSALVEEPAPGGGEGAGAGARGAAGGRAAAGASGATAAGPSRGAGSGAKDSDGLCPASAAGSE
jgi:DNA-directed RNA polymerase specialized sigma24 family protein